MSQFDASPGANNKFEKKGTVSQSELSTTMNGFIKRTLRQMLLASVVTLPLSAGAAMYTANATNELLMYAMGEVDGLTPEQRKSKPEEFKRRLEQIDSDIQKGGKWRERMRRLFSSDRKGGFIENTKPFIQMQKVWFEGGKLVQDVTYWAAFASTWLTFFTFSFGLMFKYMQTRMLKKEIVAGNVFTIEMGEDVEAVKSRIDNLEYKVDDMQEGVTYEEYESLKRDMQDMSVLNGLMVKVLEEVSKAQSEGRKVDTSLEIFNLLEEHKANFLDLHDVVISEDIMRSRGELADDQSIENYKGKIVSPDQVYKDALHKKTWFPFFGKKDK